MPTDNALEWIEDHVTLLFSLFSKTLPEQNSFSIIVAKNGWGLVLWIFIDMQHNLANASPPTLWGETFWVCLVLPHILIGNVVIVINKSSFMY